MLLVEEDLIMTQMSLLSLQAEGPNKTTKDRKSKKE